jgi:hypothetical protein
MNNIKILSLIGIISSCCVSTLTWSLSEEFKSLRERIPNVKKMAMEIQKATDAIVGQSTQQLVLPTYVKQALDYFSRMVTLYETVDGSLLLLSMPTSSLKTRVSNLFKKQGHEQSTLSSREKLRATETIRQAVDELNTLSNEIFILQSNLNNGRMRDPQDAKVIYDLLLTFLKKVKEDIGGAIFLEINRMRL